MILCCGEALIDMIPLTVQTTPAASEQKLVFHPYPGGSPYNTAIAIGRLGIPVQFLGRLSKDFFGDMLINQLIQNKVGTDLIRRSAENSTLAFVKLETGKEPQYVFYTDGTADRSLVPADIPVKLADEIQCILFGSIAMTMEPVASAIESLIFREAERKDGPVISVDPNVRPFMIHDKQAYSRRFETWIKAATILKISAVDIEFIYPDLDLERALEKLLCLGPRIIVTTLGPAGALLLLRQDNGNVLRVKAPVIDVPVADTIGAGDTFHGAFLSWLECKQKMSRSALGSLTETEAYEALFFANKAASLVCSRHGADPPTMAEVDALKSYGPTARSAPDAGQ